MSKTVIGEIDGYPLYAIDQDALDGAALRRLREAHPDKDFRIFMSGEHVYVQPDLGNEDTEGYGATIAEAADKARAALEGRDG